jgi:2-oxoglutarate ferredoxin oxidoreductase subunit gamma
MNIRFSGFGGQGIILSGVILGWAAILDGKNAIQTQSYGSSARGGACKCDVIIQDTKIYELEPEGNDILISFSQAAFNKFRKSVKKDGILFYDENLVKIDPICSKIYSLPATDLAYKEFGQKIFANMLMLGYINSITEIVKSESIEKSIRYYIPSKSLEVNIEVFRYGISLKN